MTADKLHDALTLLPSDLIAEADAVRNQRRPRIIPWKTCLSIAASLVLALGISRSLFLITAPKSSAPAAAQKEAAAAMAEAAPREESAMDAAPMETMAAADTTHLDQAAANGSITEEEAGPLSQPPQLSITSGHSSLTLEAAGYTWNTLQPDGTTNTICVDVPAPTDDPSSHPVLDAQTEAADLFWTVMPQAVTARCWHREDLSSEIPWEIRGATLPFRRGLHLYEVTAQWEASTATYVFSVNTLR